MPKPVPFLTLVTPDRGPRLKPEALAALRQLAALAREVAGDDLLLTGLRADPSLAAAVERLAAFEAPRRA